ncbi:putative protein kinase domain protein [Paratrimastix pyriformis]|uniref:Methyltransferase type 11 domain-containing protein n=1 Tax=Paratrimastix pyriformis TaxID=342808 RepID=A0ABQ8U879_9EUKA|nr:putative protein kinase domain protein [Paratrimastix pyriformis]
MSHYGKIGYWDERYSEKDTSFEWYFPYSIIRPIFHEYVQPESRILQIGCGNSHVADDLFDDGFHHISNIDISEVVVEQMRRHNRREGMTYEKMDVRHLTYPSEAFEAVIDKGTVDAIVCGEDKDLAMAELAHEVLRVLTPGGVFICISCVEPAYRFKYFQRVEFPWTVRHTTIRKEPNAEPRHVYIMIKPP